MFYVRPTIQHYYCGEKKLLLNIDDKRSKTCQILCIILAS